VHPAAEPEVGEQLDEIDAAHCRAVQQVLALAPAVEPAGNRKLGVRQRPFAVGIVEEQNSTSQKSSAERPPPPAKRTSSGFSARNSEGAIDPAAQTMASETFDFPEPFGPTTTATPGSRRISTGSGNDLKPRSLMARRFTPQEN